MAGVAGSGKSRLGQALARSLGLPLLDLDTVTNPLLEALPPECLGGHWQHSPHRVAIRRGRYAALLAVTQEVVETGGGCVVVAPFTSELQGGADWRALRRVAGTAEVRVIHLVGDHRLFDERRRQRAASRDDHRPPDPGDTAASATIPVVAVDAELTTAQQLTRVRTALGLRLSVSDTNPLFDRSFDAVLFDIDGTLVDSTASIARSWRHFAHELGLPRDAIQANHGQPARTLLGRLVEPGSVSAAVTRFEQCEVEDAHTVSATPGARQFFDEVPPSQRALVTSGTRPIATARLRAAGFPPAGHLVTAEEVQRGKPHPEPYLLAASGLGVDPARCLVVEDAPAGIASAQAAGCSVVALTGTADVNELAGADLLVDGLDVLTIAAVGHALRLRLRAGPPSC